MTLTVNKCVNENSSYSLKRFISLKFCHLLECIKSIDLLLLELGLLGAGGPRVRNNNRQCVSGCG